MRTRAQLFADAKCKRTDCDLCGRSLRLTKTRFHSRMGQALREMYKRSSRGTRWIIFKKSNKDLLYQQLLAWNFTKLPCWGLIESEKIDGQGARRRWRLTALGVQFVRGEIPIPCYVRIPTGTGNTAYGRPFGEPIYIDELKPFDRTEMLKEAT